jgi:predicted nucleic acid-binding protein
MAARDEQTLFVSAMTLAELHRGIAKLPVSRRRSDLTTWLEKLEVSFEERVLPFGSFTAKAWATMCARAEAAGSSLAAFDSIIAATAQEHGLTVVTRNVRDFAQTLVPVVNPWSEAG